MAEKPIALYFGCTEANRAGHYLHIAAGRTFHEPKELYPGFPWSIGHLDSGLLKNGKHADIEDGKVFWTCGGRVHLWFAFFWWDKSGDKRPGSNSGVYVRGFAPETLTPETAKPAAIEAFQFACGQWPKVVARQRHPLVLQGVEP